MSDAAKWSLFDLLKALDTIHNGQHHEVFWRIAQGLNLELPALPPPPDPIPPLPPGAGSDGEGEAAPEANADVARWLVECIDTSDPSAQTLAAKLYESWSQYAAREKKPAGTPTALTRELNKRFPGRSSHKAEGTAFAGLRIK